MACITLAPNTPSIAHRRGLRRCYPTLPWRLRGSRSEAGGALEKLLDALIDSLGEPSSEILSRFIAQGKQEGAGPGMEMFREQIGDPIFNAVAGLISVLTYLPVTHEHTRLRALLILGQVNWLHARREDVLMTMRWPKFSGVKTELIKHFVREHTRFALQI